MIEVSETRRVFAADHRRNGLFRDFYAVKAPLILACYMGTKI
jgi:hypothetical protein